MTPLGWPYTERAFWPRWMTVHPPTLDDIEEKGLVMSDDFLNPLLSGYESHRVGFQVFAWSFSSLVSRGILNSDGSYRGYTLIKVKRVAIPEPGGKVRIATCSEADFVTYG